MNVVKRGRIIHIIVRLIIILTMVGCVFLGIWGSAEYPDGSNYFMSAFTCLIMLIITFVPSYLNNRTRMIVPAALETAFVIFTFLAMYVGDLLNYYEKYWWWDSMLHSSSGFMLGLVGYLLFYSMNRNKDSIFEMSNACIILFAFCFAMTCGVLWEFFEFGMDYLTGSNMQKSIYVTDIQEMSRYINSWGRMMDPGLVDTMKDLIVDAIGAAAAVLGGYLFIRHHNGNKRKIASILEEAENNSIEG